MEGRRARKVSEKAFELTEVHRAKPKLQKLQASNSTSSGYLSPTAGETSPKPKAYQLTKSIVPIPEESSLQEAYNSRPDRLESPGKSPQHLYRQSNDLLSPGNIDLSPRRPRRKVAAVLDKWEAEETVLQLLNLNQNRSLRESYSPSIESARSSTSNFSELTPVLGGSKTLQTDPYVCMKKGIPDSDSDESDGGFRGDEQISKTSTLQKREVLGRTDGMRLGESTTTRKFSKDYLRDDRSEIKDYEVKSLIEKEKVSQAASLPSEQKFKLKSKLKRSISTLQNRKASKGLRRFSEAAIPKIRIHGAESENDGPPSPKRKQSFFEKFISTHSPMSFKRKNLQKSKSSSVLSASQLGEASVSNPNLLDAERLKEQKFKESAAKELRKFYSELHVPMASPWMKKRMEINDIFVEPVLTFNRKQVPLEKLFVVKPNRSSKNPLIVIKGQPGSGKTALCQYLVHCWCQNNTRIPDLNSIDLLFMIESRFVTSSLLSSLRTIYLKDSISHIPQAEKDDKYFFKVINKWRTLIILDGFDEIQDSQLDVLKDIKNILPDATILVSTRLSGIRDIQATFDIDVSYDAVEFLLKLFDEEQLVSLVMNVSRIYGVSDEKENELLDHIDDNQLTSMLKAPLHLILYLMLWIHEPAIAKSIKTVIDIFDGVVSSIRNQISSCLGDGMTSSLTTENLAQQWLNDLGQVCLQCVQDRQFYFTPKEYESLKASSEAWNIDHHYAFKIIMSEVTYLAGRNLRTFCHVTVMEHFAATYMDFNIRENDRGIFETLAPNRSFNTVSGNCWASCAATASSATNKVTNSGSRNYQLDSTISHLAQISCKNDYNTFRMGEELATYFSLNNNRNLVTLSNIISRLEKRDGPFKEGLKKGLSNQSLPDQIHVWNLPHVIKIIEYGALKPSIPVKFSVENSKEWGTVVNDLVNLGCRPFVKVVLEDSDQMDALIRALKVIENPTIPKLILHFGFIDIGINDLVETWPYPKTMHIVSPAGQYAIDSYLACLLLVKAMGNDRVRHIRFTGHESSYIFNLLKKSLNNVKIQLQPYAWDGVQFEIFMKSDKSLI